MKEEGQMENFVQIAENAWVKPGEVVAIRRIVWAEDSGETIRVHFHGGYFDSDYNFEITQLILARRPNTFVNLKIWESESPKRKVDINVEYDPRNPKWPNIEITEDGKRILYAEYEARKWTDDDAFEWLCAHGWLELEKHLKAKPASQVKSVKKFAKKPVKKK